MQVNPEINSDMVIVIKYNGEIEADPWIILIDIHFVICYVYM